MPSLYTATVRFHQRHDSQNRVRRRQACRRGSREHSLAPIARNSAKTLADVAGHYRKCFLVVTDFDGPGHVPPLIVLTEQDKRDNVAYMKLLN